MSFIPLADSEGTPFEKLLAYVPEIAEKWSALELTFFSRNIFDPTFLEQVRKSLALINECDYCIAKGCEIEFEDSSKKTQAAIDFAKKFAKEHQNIVKEEIDALQQYFSLSEIVELIAFCSFITASQKIGATLGLQPLQAYQTEAI